MHDRRCGVPNGTLIYVAAPPPVEREGSAAGMASPHTGHTVGLLKRPPITGVIVGVGFVAATCFNVVAVLRVPPKLRGRFRAVGHLALPAVHLWPLRAEPSHVRPAYRTRPVGCRSARSVWRQGGTHRRYRFPAGHHAVGFRLSFPLTPADGRSSRAVAAASQHTDPSEGDRLLDACLVAAQDTPASDHPGRLWSL